MSWKPEIHCEICSGSIKMWTDSAPDAKVRKSDDRSDMADYKRSDEMERPRLVVAAAVIERAGRVMVCQRRPEAHNGLKWEFPGGKLESGESPEEALCRELREELAIEAEAGQILDAVYHNYADRDVLVLFYRCAILSGEPRTVDCNAISWVEPEKLPDCDFAGADRIFVERLDLRQFEPENV